MSTPPPTETARAFPTWAKAASVVAGLAWLASLGIVVLANAPSSSPSENMNGLVILFLPYTLLPAAGLTTAVLVAWFYYARSLQDSGSASPSWIVMTISSVLVVLTALITVASCIAGLYLM